MGKAKNYLITVALSFAAGSFAGYMVAYMTQDDVKAMTALVQTELQALSRQLSTSQHSVYYTNTSNDSRQFQGNSAAKQILPDELTLIIRDAIRTELVPMFAGMHQGSNMTQPVPPIDPDVTRAGVEAADAVLAAAKARGAWDASSAQAFDKALQKLSGREWDQAMSKLVMAINNGEITSNDFPGLLQHMGQSQ